MSTHIPADLATSPHDFDPQDATSGVHFVTSYNGSHGHGAPCTKAEWKVIRPSFMAAMAPVSDLTSRGIRRYATAYARLSSWALVQGLDLEPTRLLSAEVAEAFLAGQRVGQADQRGVLRRLARAHGVAEATTPLGYHKRQMPAPYAAAECEALWSYASTLSNHQRRTSLQALLTLGLGCGLARTSLRGVTAESLHAHEREIFVRSGERCAKVRPEYTSRLKKVCLARPEGELIGKPTKNITAKIVVWVSGRVGVPALHPDRLRATYICAWLEDGAGLLDLMAWTGVRRMESIGQYHSYLKPRTVTCPMDGDDAGGAL
jgi:hypothetical protein